MYFEYGIEAAELKQKTAERAKEVLRNSLEKEISNAAWNGIYQVEFHFDPTQYRDMMRLERKLKDSGFFTNLVEETELGYGYINVSWT